MWKEQVWVQVGPEIGRGGGALGAGLMEQRLGWSLESVSLIYPTLLCPPGGLAPLHSARLRHRGAHEAGKLCLGQLWVSLGWVETVVGLRGGLLGGGTLGDTL